MPFEKRYWNGNLAHSTDYEYDENQNFNLSCIPSDSIKDNINSVANVTTQLRDVRQSYREKFYSTKSKTVDAEIANTNSTDQEALCTDKADSPTESSHDETQTGKSAVHTWRKGTTLIAGDSMLGGVKEGLGKHES